ncbi:MAG: type II secretion system minor pseudopilin GspK [Gammaproteobacteria bacterium]|nr:type II secretion system minor pseudopilin GspK [Gammaproteobacteria bacterium]
MVTPYTKNMMSTQKGVALITVLLVVALATTAAVAMASRQHIDVRRTENTLFMGQAQQYLQGVELWSKQFLSQDRKDNQIDHNKENWATRLPPLPVEGGYVEGHLLDLQGRFNLNNLQLTGNDGKRELERFQRLLRILGINENLAYLVQDWLDPNIDAHLAGGAEDVYYLSLQPAYRTSNQLFKSVSELLLLKEVKREDYDKLLPHITVLPQVTTININTATLEILMSLHTDLTSNEIMTIIDEDRKFENVEDLLKQSAFTGKQIPTDGLGVSSDYFILKSEASIGHLKLNTQSLFERNDKGYVKTLARSEGEL